MINYVEKTIKTYNRLAKDYAASNLDRNGPAVTRLEKFAQLLPGIKVLEIGFGLGKDAQWLVEHGFEYTGVDSTTEYCRLLTKSLAEKVTVKEGDIRQVSLPSRYFDGVWAMASLLHFRTVDMCQILQKCHLSLHENGILFASLKTGTSYKVDSSGRFFQYYSEAKFLKIAEIQNFEPIEVISGKPNSTYQSQDSWNSYFLRKK